jgi:hypothetical protein
MVVVVVRMVLQMMMMVMAMGDILDRFVFHLFSYYIYQVVRYLYI